ncbi:hypothetical protein BJ742DRAFT_780438 [Cladochytrium replicatum]|nr:hypothetical protein BJ742DRAFT_780438 [Cladochytrium replicatum]
MNPADESQERRERLRALNDEVTQLAKHLSPRPQESALREWIVDRLTNLILRDILGWSENDARVAIFGSQATGLCLPDSDVDLVVQHNSLNNNSVLAYIHQAIVSRPGLIAEPGSEDLILQARVPVLKFKSCIGKLKVDISANNTSGESSSTLVRKWVTVDYSPHLRPLALIIKYWVQIKGFAEVYTGGLGGYSILNMLVSVIQHFPPNAISSHPLARILLAFFETFGVKFDYHRRAISVRLARHIDRPPEVYRMGYGSRASDLRLYIEDPTDTSNNVSKGTFRMEEIRKAMQIAYVVLDDGLEGLFYPRDGKLISEVVEVDMVLDRWRDQVCDEWDAFVAGFDNVDEWKMMVGDPGYDDQHGYEFEEVRGRSMSSDWNGESRATAVSPSTAVQYECTPTPVEEARLIGEKSRKKKRRERSRDRSERRTRKYHKKRRRKDRSEMSTERSLERERDGGNRGDDERKSNDRVENEDVDQDFRSRGDRKSRSRSRSRSRRHRSKNSKKSKSRRRTRSRSRSRSRTPDKRRDPSPYGPPRESEPNSHENNKEGRSRSCSRDRSSRRSKRRRSRTRFRSRSRSNRDRSRQSGSKDERDGSKSPPISPSGGASGRGLDEDMGGKEEADVKRIGEEDTSGPGI